MSYEVEIIYKLYPNVVKTKGEFPNVTCYDINNSVVEINVEEVTKMPAEYAEKQIEQLYDNAMRTLQNGYSDEEVKTFRSKQAAMDEYLSTEPKSVANLSDRSRTLMEGITGSTDDAVIGAKLDNIVNAAMTEAQYSGIIEYQRDFHLDQLVDGQDNSPIVASLKAIYGQMAG